jgi:hypothetical protein
MDARTLSRRFALAIGALLLWVASASATIIRVPSEQPTIQAGIDAASVGDTVLVAPGTYTGPGNRSMNFGGKDIVLRSAAGPDLTIIDCQGWPGDPRRAFRFDSGETESAVIEGFTVQHGYEHTGGGIYTRDSSPSVTDCIFRENGGLDNAAVFLSNSHSLISDCVFVNNETSGGGDWGGAIGIGDGASPRIVNCDFEGNTCDPGPGGAIRCWYAGDPEIHGCTFTSNAGTLGAAVSVSISASVAISDCTFHHNRAVYRGGAILLHSVPVSEIRDCTLAANFGPIEGGGLWVSGASYVLVENTCIVFSAEGEGVFCEQNSTVTLSCCDVYGNAGGDWVGCIEDQYGINGNINEDPLFCDMANGDFTLHAASPCAPENSGGCGLIGALPVNCGVTALEPTTWGAIKASWR